MLMEATLEIEFRDIKLVFIVTAQQLYEMFI